MRRTWLIPVMLAVVGCGSRASEMECEPGDWEQRQVQECGGCYMRCRDCDNTGQWTEWYCCGDCDPGDIWDDPDVPTDTVIIPDAADIPSDEVDVTADGPVDELDVTDFTDLDDPVDVDAQEHVPCEPMLSYGGLCNVVDQCTCPDGAGCQLAHAGGTMYCYVEETCVWIEPTHGDVGDVCSFMNCRPGTFCSGGRCHEVCLTDADCSDPTSTCLLHIPLDQLDVRDLTCYTNTAEPYKLCTL